MSSLATNEPLDARDGLNPTRALILQSYYALRRECAPTEIGVPLITGWIRAHEPGAVVSDSLVLLTLREAKVLHRGRGRPRVGSPRRYSPLSPGR